MRCIYTFTAYVPESCFIFYFFFLSYFLHSSLYSSNNITYYLFMRHVYDDSLCLARVQTPLHIIYTNSICYMVVQSQTYHNTRKIFQLKLCFTYAGCWFALSSALSASRMLQSICFLPLSNFETLRSSAEPSLFVSRHHCSMVHSNV